MITADQVTPIIVTRGDVAVEPMVKSLHKKWSGRFADVLVKINMIGPDLSVYGRYAMIEHATTPVILVQDDDVLLPPETIKGLLDAYEPGKIVANMPPEYRARYTDSCLVGFGAIFDRDLPAEAFERFDYDEGCLDEFFFRRTCDVVFTTLTPFTLVDLPFTYLPHTRAENRMYRQPGHSEERARMLRLARKVRDA